MTAAASTRASAFPIPHEALDDRLAFVGTAGSGKTYAAGTAAERLLSANARVVIVDPLGVWHGLRLQADGKTPAFPVVIFGGAHADLPLTEHAGALIGETAAMMAESCILDLSDLGTKASERRFMLAFLTALYRKTPGEPLHVVFDEADMFAPQMVADKDGEAVKLLGMMETIVRRGRVKGFVPWLITQRPAVLNKNVLSQADGLIALKLTSSQDRAALGDWIEGQADRAEGKRILGEMPTLQRGQALVWLPARAVLTTVQFPKKATFDSSRTPARGETKRTLKLKPLDLDTLKDKLGQVEAEIKANDPRALKAEVARLQRELAAAQKHPAAAPAPQIAADAIRAKAFAEGAASRDCDVHDAFARGFDAALEKTEAALSGVRKALPPPPPRKAALPPAKVAPIAAPKPASKPQKASIAASSLTRPQMKIIESLAFWVGLGFNEPTREQLAAVAGYSPSSGGFGNLLGQMRGVGLIDYTRPGCVSLTEAGGEIPVDVDDGRSVRDRLGDVLSNPQLKIIDALPTDGSALSKGELAEATEYSATSGGFGNLLGSLRTLGIITYPSPGFVAVEPWVHK